jgi:putative DNA primase/helicase
MNVDPLTDHDDGWNELLPGFVPAGGFEQPVDLADLLEQIYRFYNRFVVMSEAELVALSLWTVQTYVFECFDYIAYIHVWSPQPESGKTTLLSSIEKLAARAIKADSVSPASVYRYVDKVRPTFLLDEADTLLGRNADKETATALRGVLNGGFHRGGQVIRCEPPSHDPVPFSTYCPKVTAGVGSFLNDATRSRTIRIALKRKKRSERVDKFRERTVAPVADEIKAKVEAWAQAVDRDALGEAEPVIPEELGDRQADIWEGMFVIAVNAGDRWLDRARKAALELAGAEQAEEDGIGLQLLRGVRSVLEPEKGEPIEKILTPDLIDSICRVEDAPWSEYSTGKRISARQVAGLLRPYGIKPSKWREGEATVRGYRRDAFRDAWERYPSREPEDAPDPPHPPQRLNHAGLSPIQDPPQNPFVADGKVPANPHEHWVVAGVAFQGGGDGDEHDIWATPGDVADPDEAPRDLLDQLFPETVSPSSNGSLHQLPRKVHTPETAAPPVVTEADIWADRIDASEGVE